MITSFLDNVTIQMNLRTNLTSFLEKECSNISDIQTNNEIHSIVDSVIQNMKNWLESDIPQSFKEPIEIAIQQKRWGELTEAFAQELNFGTSGIREKLTVAINNDVARSELSSLIRYGTAAPILRGTNTINEVIVARYSHELAKLMKKYKMTKLVIGYDSRVNGKVFSNIISQIMLKSGFKVFMFNTESSLPELVFSVKLLKADLGIEITASHNDKRYNGLKLITNDGGPPSNKIRNDLIRLFSKQYNPITKSGENKSNKKILSTDLTFLNKKTGLKTKTILIRKRYISHIKNFILQKNILLQNSNNMKIGYSAIHGTGYSLASRLFKEIGIKNVKYVSAMNYPDPIFSSFKINQILDPGETSVANVVVNEFIKQYGKREFESLDMLLYNDPDADRLGVITKVSKNEKQFYGHWKLHKAETIWALLLWYILENLPKLSNIDKKNLFIVKSYLTSDLLSAVAKKYGIQYNVLLKSKYW